MPGSSPVGLRPGVRPGFPPDGGRAAAPGRLPGGGRRPPPRPRRTGRPHRGRRRAGRRVLRAPRRPARGSRSAARPPRAPGRWSRPRRPPGSRDGGPSPAPRARRTRAWGRRATRAGSPRARGHLRGRRPLRRVRRPAPPPQLDHPRRRLGGRLGGVVPAAGEALTEHHAERVDVRRRRHLLPVELLGREVRRGPRGSSGSTGAVHTNGSARTGSPRSAQAMPKSSTFTPSGVRNTFAGLTSRCTSPARWAAASASRDLPAHPDRLGDRQRSAGEPLGEGLPVAGTPSPGTACARRTRPRSRRSRGSPPPAGG